MYKLLLAIIGLILVVFVSSNQETDNQNTDISLQNDLLISDAREAGRKDKKSKAGKKRKNKSKSKKKKGEKKRKNKTEKKTEGSRRIKGKKLKAKRRLKTKQRKSKGSGKRKKKNIKNKSSNRKGGKPMNEGRRKSNKSGDPGDHASLASTTEEPSQTQEKCIKDLQKAMNIWRTAANNFKNKQAKRIDRQLKVMKNKFDKSGDFSAVRASVIIVGGGNSKALECQGSTTSTVAKSMTELAENLDKCNNNIKTDCNSQNLVDQMELEQCSMKVTKFEEEATKCNDDYQDGSEEACMCWDMLANGKQIPHLLAFD